MVEGHSPKLNHPPISSLPSDPHGELSAFGERCVREIFKRVNHDGGSLTFESFVAMARLLGVPPPADEKEYMNVVREGGFQTNRLGHLTLEGCNMEVGTLPTPKPVRKPPVRLLFLTLGGTYCVLRALWPAG